MAANDVNSSDVNGECGRLYLAALKGDWNSIEDMTNIQRPISRKEETTLHIAAAANHEDFVKKLLSWMTSNSCNLKDVNKAGNTALTYAAAAGNVKIAEVMLEKDNELPNEGSGVKPLVMAASLGHRQMVELLYSKTMIDTSEQVDIFINCVRKDIYGVALKMLNDNSNLATATNSDGETALHVLARKPSAFVNESQLGVLRRHINITWLKSKQENSKHSQVNELLKKCLQGYRGDVENSNETPVISYVLFEAAEVGNIEFLVKLICFDFDLLWTTIDKKSIFHIAVEKHHESIFKLFNEIGSIGDLIVDGLFEDESNILHLAAKLAPQEKLNAISGAALQMQQELLWFKEVEKAVKPAFQEMKNTKGETPYDLFASNHENLRKEGEKWMMNTAKSSMVVATLIGTIVFSDQAVDKSNLSPKLFLAYSISSAIALFGSSTSLIMFLAILISRYSYEDFVVRLPIRLMIGVTSLFISIAAMMVVFSTSFWLRNINHQELSLIFVVIGLFACVPILYLLIKYRLLVDILQSTFFQFQPQHLLLKASYAPLCSGNPTPAA
ncbi:hypothetical protein CMV_026217 [Castanea mollissima]|uniref:PGG domain-containing protein n=1 Tax=Castanea mollissima TaxID=60419 RepID=A0A8J4QHR3_9ROSI|nr:hypothetical protein CMV_026217 [Castanea mollissima]